MLDRTILDKKSKSLIFLLLLFVIISSSLTIGQENQPEQQPTQEENTETTEENIPEPAKEIIEETQIIQEPEEQETIEEPEELTEEIYIDLEEITQPLKETPEEIETTEEPTKTEIIEQGKSSEKETPEETYEYVELEEIVQEPIIEEQTEPEQTTEEIPHVFYKGNKKEIEATFSENEKVEIKKDESVEDENGWKKNVKVYSDEHVKSPVTVYADILEAPKEKIKVYWKQEDKFLDFKTFDKNNNGLIERISWIVPHLSEQNFEIIVDISATEVPSLQEIEITRINAPSSEEISPVNFEFNLSYSNITAVTCNFSLESYQNNNINLQDQATTNINFNLTLENDAYLWELVCQDQNDLSVSSSDSDSFFIETNYTPQINFAVNNQNPEKDQSVTFQIDITTQIEGTLYYNLEYENGDSDVGLPENNVKNYQTQINHIYQTEGSKTATLTAYADYNGVIHQNSKTINIQVESNTEEDTENPEITLVDPEDDDTIYEDEITFSYKANDNHKVQNCTFNLYYYNNSALGTLVYTKFEDDIEHDEKVFVELVDFDEGDYSWDVECYDNSTNYRDRGRDLTVDLSTTIPTQTKNTFTNLENAPEEISEIDEILKTINDFLIKEEKYTTKQKEVIEDLNIIEDLKFYKKKLLQMKIDLEHNLDYIRGDNKRDQRRDEILSELEEIKENVPEEISVLKSHEYYKNSIEQNIEEIVNAYIEKKNIVLDKRGIRKMVEENEALINYITVSTKVKQLEIKYQDRTEKSTLVVKEIEIKNNSFDAIVETIPKNIAQTAQELTFRNKHEVIKSDPVIEIKQEDLINGKIIYSQNKLIEPEEIETTNTNAFKEEIPASDLGAITGFVTLIGYGNTNSFWFFFSWAIFIMAFLAIGTFAIKTTTTKNLKKKSTEFKKILEVITTAEKSLKDKKIDEAREKYQEAQTLYLNIPNKCKKITYKKLEKLYLAIDKKDAGLLIKEFLAAVKEQQTGQALAIYEDIQKIYSRMPKKYKEIVYKKIIPQVKKFRDL